MQCEHGITIVYKEYKDVAAWTGSGGHNYIGHYKKPVAAGIGSGGHNYIGRSYIGHRYIGHNHIPVAAGIGSGGDAACKLHCRFSCSNTPPVIEPARTRVPGAPASVCARACAVARECCAYAARGPGLGRRPGAPA